MQTTVKEYTPHHWTPEYEADLKMQLALTFKEWMVQHGHLHQMDTFGIPIPTVTVPYPGCDGTMAQEEEEEDEQQGEVREMKGGQMPSLPVNVQRHRNQTQVPSRVLEAVHELAELASEGHMQREDLEVAVQLYQFIPHDEEGYMMSLGSILHAVDSCKPCAFWRRGTCHKKELCTYCHFEHDISRIPKRTRKSKGKRKSMPVPARVQQHAERSLMSL